MILRTLKSNGQVNLLILPVIGILFWLKSLLYPFSYNFFPGEKENILFYPFFRLVENSEFWQVFISLLLVLVLALIVQLLNDRFSFIRKRTKLPVNLFLVIVAGYTQLHTFHPVFPAAICLLFALYFLFGSFGKTKPYSNIFNAGFLLGLGTLFYFNLIILLPAFILGIFILSRESNWRSYTILLIGLITPLFLAFSYAALNEKALEMLKIFEENIITPVNHFRTNIPLHGLLTFLVILTLTGTIKILQQYDSKKVSTRKYFSVFFVIFIFSMLSFAFIPVTSQEMLVILAIPVTYLISNLLVFINSRFWSELLFLLLFGIVVFMQFADKFMLNG